MVEILPRADRLLCEIILLNLGTDIYDFSLHAIAKSKGLRVNSLLKHIDEIRVLLEKYTFDILAINESKIDNSIYPIMNSRNRI